MKFKLSKGKFFVLAILSLTAIHFVFFRAPSESQMLADFHAHKAEFEQLRAMLAQDKNVKVIGPDWTIAQWSSKPNGVGSSELPLNVSNARLVHYRALLKQLGTKTVVVDEEQNRIRLARFGGGFTDTSWGIGYAWCQKPPKALVKSAYSQHPGRDKMHFSRIEGDWYLYHLR